MTRRGLTMLEVLLSLAVLGGVTALLTPWLSATARLQRDALPDLGWRRSAEAVLQLIADDLAIGDFGARADGATPRVEVTDDQSLRLRTRGRTGVGDPPGPMARVYRFERLAGRLVADAEPLARLDASIRFDRDRALLDDVADWACEWDADTRRLRVVIESGRGAIVEREYHAP